MTSATDAFIAEKRALLDCLERFATTADYQRLVEIVAPLAAGDLEPWLAEWLITRAFGLGERPIDMVVRPGGMQAVEQHLMQIGAGGVG
ncbi:MULTISPECIES: antitoxin Xre/MbcA/ParS toxin-binding domain-containing protein [unclassified Roseateles]|uniref:antitoxin Xre/MbcA/ParS toxin-binding domain-containing protein n=1 Tax=unclassified Roseateles TaxID=2626991 RepID=UPI0006F8ABEE|nr:MULTISPECIES: antitoxin Xre/MbcA/ParS toxin-binding domain-containing protein [unclassified Roseateles]KQW51236.1 hypothetical protein ASC81_00875 [Pelomonas sp. Root405]KRA77468.1 hypothetical protein ASD88_00875 [Pelomonas sp. Root662]